MATYTREGPGELVCSMHTHRSEWQLVHALLSMLQANVVPQGRLHPASMRKWRDTASDSRRCISGSATALVATDVPWLHSLTRSTPRGTASSSETPSEQQQQCPPPTDFDAIVVLAGGQTTSGSGLPPWVERRLDTSLGLQRLQQRRESGKPCPIVCLGGY